MAPSWRRKHKVRHNRIAPHKPIFYFFLCFCSLPSLVLHQLCLLRQVRAQTAVKKRGNMWNMKITPLGLLNVVSYEFLRVVYRPVKHSCLYN